MNKQEQIAIITLALMAAFADGDNSEVERGEIKRVAELLSKDGDIDVKAIYEDVLARRVNQTDAVSQLTTSESRRLAFELCVCVCDIDGRQNGAEKVFLDKLRATLALDPAATIAANTFSTSAAALTDAPLGKPTAFEPPATTSTMSAAEQDKLILHYAILNGALELLPETLASMAIIPLQMKLVYRLGKSYGYELDKGHIKDFLATAGVGLASQYVEQLGVKLIGKVFGSGLIGGLIGGLAKQAVSTGMSFSTTYALGQLGKRYYAGGRTFSTAVLKDAYSALLGEAKSMHGQYLPAIKEKARTINVAEVLQQVRE